MRAVRQPWPMTAAGLDAVMALMETGFSPDFGERWSRAQLIGLLTTDKRAWLTGLGDVAGRKTLSGFALVRAVTDSAELMLLAVDPAQRRNGLGGTLLAAVVEEARDRGAKELFAEVREGNPAQSFYHSLGFVTVGRRTGYYRDTAGTRHDALTVQLRL